jgi:hypothetical protein
MGFREVGSDADFGGHHLNGRHRIDHIEGATRGTIGSSPFIISCRCNLSSIETTGLGLPPGGLLLVQSLGCQFELGWLRGSGEAATAKTQNSGGNADAKKVHATDLMGHFSPGKPLVKDSLRPHVDYFPVRKYATMSATSWAFSPSWVALSIMLWLSFRRLLIRDLATY